MTTTVKEMELTVDRTVNDLTIRDYQPKPHECHSEGGVRCDVCFGEIPGNPVAAKLTLYPGVELSPERYVELKEWLQTLVTLAEKGFPLSKYEYYFYKGLPQ